MKIWLDDVRPMPSGFDIHVPTAQEAIRLLITGTVTEISLDHDLGPEEAGTGYDVAKWIEEAAYFNNVPRLKWNVHSANPVGIANMEAALLQANAYWSGHED